MCTFFKLDRFSIGIGLITGAFALKDYDGRAAVIAMILGVYLLGQHVGETRATENYDKVLRI